jgi:hypothetical protein
MIRVIQEPVTVGHWTTWMEDNSMEGTIRVFVSRREQDGSILFLFPTDGCFVTHRYEAGTVPVDPEPEPFVEITHGTLGFMDLQDAFQSLAQALGAKAPPLKDDYKEGYLAGQLQVMKEWKDSLL